MTTAPCSCGGIDAVPHATDHTRDCSIWAYRAVVDAAANAAAARDDLNAAIRKARDEGLSLRAIGKAAGLSPEWVRRIAAQK